MVGPPRPCYASLQSSYLFPPSPTMSLALPLIITISRDRALYDVPGTAPGPSHTLSSHNGPLSWKPV